MAKVYVNNNNIPTLVDQSTIGTTDYTQLSNKPTIPTKTSQLTNDSNFLTSHQSLSNYVTLNTTQTISGAKTFSSALKAASLQATSDRRAKDCIEKIDRDLTQINTYKYILKSINLPRVGLMADEVAKVIPEAVIEDENGMLSLDYNAVVAVLVGEVNKLKKRLEALENGSNN